MTITSGQSEQLGATDTDSSRSKWLAILSFVLVVILWFELDWFNQNIYKHDPWIEIIEPAYIDKLVNWIFGFFIVSVGAAAFRGKLQFLLKPSVFLGKDYFNFLSGRIAAIVFGGLVVGVFVIIIFNPAVHLDYVEPGAKPTVIHNGNVSHFDDTTVFLSIDPAELSSHDIEIAGRHDLYRISIDPLDFSQTRLLLAKHARIDLQDVFLRRDFRAQLLDTNEREIGSFVFTYESLMSLSEQCADSESGLEGHFSGSECDGFFRELFEDITESSGRMLEDTMGSLIYDNREYNYRYDFGPTIEIDLVVSIAESAFATRPLNAFNLYLNASPDDRSQFVEEFRRDTEIVPAAQLAEVFESLASPAELHAQLNGTVALRGDSLAFVRDVLALGVDHFGPEQLQALVEEVADTNLNRIAHPTSLLLAIDTIVTLTRADYAFDRLEAFVRELETDHNALKSQMTRILLRDFNDNMDYDEATQIVSIVGRLWQSAQGVETTINEIRSEVGDRLDSLNNSDLRQILREFDTGPL